MTTSPPAGPSPTRPPSVATLGLLVAALVATVVAFAAGVRWGRRGWTPPPTADDVACRDAERAERERVARTHYEAERNERAFEFERTTRARAAGLAALSDPARMTDPMQSLLLAREAVRTSPTPAAVAALRRALLGSQERAMRKLADVPVTAFAWVGNDLVAGTDEGSVFRWTPAKGAEPHQLPSHSSTVQFVLFAPRTGVTLTASEDGSARLLDQDGAVTAELRMPSGISAAVFSFDGRTIALGARDGSIRVFGVDGSEKASLVGHEGAIRALAFSPDGTAVLSGSMDTTARLWSVTGEARAVLRDHGTPVLDVDWYGDRIATAAKGGTARLWTPNGEELARLDGHSGAVTCIHFRGNGECITGGEDGTVRFWSPAGALIGASPAHAAQVTSLAAQATSIAETRRRGVLSASWDGTAKLLDGDGRQLVAFVPRGGWIDSAAFSPDESRVATCARDGTVRVFDVLPSELLRIGGSSPFATFVSADCIAVGTGAFVSAWHVVKGGCVWTESDPRSLTVQQMVAQSANSLQASAGGISAQSTRDGEVIVHDQNGGIAAEFTAGMGYVRSVAVSPDGRFVATVHDDSVRVWAVDVKDLLALADRRVTRDFVDEERAAWADLLPPR